MPINEKDLLKFLNILNRFTAIPDDQMDLFQKFLTKTTYKKQDFFVTFGEKSRYAGFILDGLFRLYYIDLKGREYTKNFLHTNHFLAPYSSLLQGKPSDLYIQALTDSEVLQFDYYELSKLADSHYCWHIVLRKLTEGAYIQKEKRESDLLFYDSETRYNHFKSEYPELSKYVKQHHIASFLGMSPETLSRIKNNKN